MSVDHSCCEIESVEIDSKLFQGLGLLYREYSITLKQDGKTFAIHVPRPVAFPLHAKAERALQKMINDRIIVPVDEPTEWVASNYGGSAKARLRQRKHMQRLRCS